MSDRSIIEQLDKIKAILSKLDGGKQEKMVYDMTKLYVGMMHGEPYIMAGSSTDDYYRFHTFADNKTEQGWARAMKTGQKCLDYHLAGGFAIKEFDDTREALKYFLSKLES